MKQGMNVVVKNGSMSNGSFEHAGIITQVWSITGGSRGTAYATCNVMAFPDCGTPCTVSSVFIYPTREDAYAAEPNAQYIGWLA